jgi:hypothetical protein
MNKTRIIPAIVIGLMVLSSGCIGQDVEESPDSYTQEDGFNFILVVLAIAVAIAAFSGGIYLLQGWFTFTDKEIKEFFQVMVILEMLILGVALLLFIVSLFVK